MTSTSTSRPAADAALLSPIDGARRPSLDVWSRVFLRLVASLGAGELHVILPNGHEATFTAPRLPGPRGVLRIERSRAIRRLLVGGEIAFAEAYMDGDWDTRI